MFLKIHSRFKHLKKRGFEDIQTMVNNNWNLLQGKAGI